MFPTNGMESEVSPIMTQGWKDVVLGENMTHVSLEAPKVISGDEGLEIVILDNLVDSVLVNPKLCLVGRFVVFHPSIKMVRNWIS